MPFSALVPASWQLPPDIQQRLGDRPSRQRAMVAGGHLLLILHAPPKAEERERAGRLFWRNATGEWQSTHHGAGPEALNKHLDEYDKILIHYDHAEDNFKDVETLRQVLDGLVPLQRSTRNQHQALQDARKWVGDDRHLINVRDRAYELERSAEIIYQDVKNNLEFVTARQGEEQANSAHEMSVAAHRLNLLVAFFFPLATLCTLFGMELKNGLEEALPPPRAFFTIVGLGLLLGFILATVLFRKSRRKHVNQERR